MRRLTGYSLVELVIVIVVLSIISGVISLLFQRQFEGYFASRNISINQRDALFSERYLTQDLQEIRTPADITTMTADTITFVNKTGTTLTYTVTSNQLTRNDGSSTQTIANNVTTFGLTYYDLTGATAATAADVKYINVNLVLQQDTLKSLINMTIYPRY